MSNKISTSLTRKSQRLLNDIRETMDNPHLSRELLRDYFSQSEIQEEIENHLMDCMECQEEADRILAEIVPQHHTPEELEQIAERIRRHAMESDAPHAEQQLTLHLKPLREFLDVVTPRIPEWKALPLYAAVPQTFDALNSGAFTLRPAGAHLGATDQSAAQSDKANDFNPAPLAAEPHEFRSIARTGVAVIQPNTAPLIVEWDTKNERICIRAADNRALLRVEFRAEGSEELLWSQESSEGIIDIPAETLHAKLMQSSLQIELFVSTPS